MADKGVPGKKNREDEGTAGLLVAQANEVGPD